MAIILKDVNDLAGELRRLSNLRFDAVVKKNMAEIFQRGKVRGSGTPVDTGELIGSLGMAGEEVGYTKTYAPHVEYGHRTVNGGWVPGQRFLKRNVDTQRPIFERDLKKQLRRAK